MSKLGERYSHIPIKSEWWHDGHALRPLTPRQRQVLALSWYAACEIAPKLGIDRSTVKNTRACIYCKLGIRATTTEITRIRAVIRAVQKGVMRLADFEIGERTRLAEAEERFLDGLDWDEKYARKRKTSIAR